MNIRHRQKDSWRKEVLVASDLQDGRFRIVTDAAIERFDDALLPKLADRAGEIIRRLSLSERSPRHGSDQAQKKHRQTPHGIDLPVYTRLLSSSTAPALKMKTGRHRMPRQPKAARDTFPKS